MSSTIVNDVVKPDFVSGAEPAMPTGLADFAVADAAVERLRMAAAARACAEAELAAAVVGVADLVGDRNYDSLEVAAVLAWTPRFAAGEVAWCRSLMENLPRVFGEWRAGRIDRHRAWVFADCLSVLILAGDDALLRAARQIADRVLPQAPRWTASRLRARLLRLVLAADPAAAVKRAEATVADRDVWLGDGGDGATASLTAFNLPAGRAATAFERVDAIARARRAGGDARTLAQLRADTVLDLLDGTAAADLPAPAGRQGVLELQIPLATAIGADTAPGELAGYGPVLADVACQIAAHRRDAQWRFSVTYRGELVYQGITTARPDTDTPIPPRPGRQATSSARPDEDAVLPVRPISLTDYLTGQPITAVQAHVPHPPAETDPGRRFPGEKLKRWITARDRTCRAPGCQVPARSCQYDHTVDYADGGPTSHDNTALMCEHHHAEKHDGWWTVIQPAPGRIFWISPHGHVYRQPPD